MHPPHKPQAAQLGFSFDYLNGISRPDRVPQSGPGLEAQSVIVASPEEYDYNELTLENIFFSCGSAIRLTPSRARMTGAVWCVSAGRGRGRGRGEVECEGQGEGGA